MKVCISHAVMAILQNLGEEDFYIKYGDRICQIIIEYVAPTVLQEVHSLPKTVRGTGGFGSTGVSLKENIAFNENYDTELPPHTQ